MHSIMYSWEAMWVMNRLVEGDLNAPSDYLEHHQARAGHKGMRSEVFEQETKLSVDAFMKRTLTKYMNSGN